MENFLYTNLYYGGGEFSDSCYKEGVIGTTIFHEINPECLDFISRARFFYLKNLSLKNPKPFFVPNELNKEEKALMYLSFKDFENAKKALEVDLKYEIIGVEAIGRTGAISKRLFLQLEVNNESSVILNSIENTNYNVRDLNSIQHGVEHKNCDVLDANSIRNEMESSIVSLNNHNLRNFKTDFYTFNDLKVRCLGRRDLIYLYIEMMKLRSTEENENLLVPRMVAFLERALFEGNDLDNEIRNAFLFLRADYVKETKSLEIILNERDSLKNAFNEISNIGNISTDCIRSSYIINQEEHNRGERLMVIKTEVFSSPIIFRSDVEMRLGSLLLEMRDYSGAYEILQKYPAFEERIECLVGMRNTVDAVRDIEQYINILKNPPIDREKQIILSNMYLKLGHLLGDCRYFDMAAEMFRSSKPYKVKGLWLFHNKMYVEAEKAFRKALEITECDESTTYLYGCTLVEISRYAEALRIFRKLRDENRRNTDIARNLSFCQYKLGEIHEALETLRNRAIQDVVAMNQFVFISARNNLTENVKWALRRMNYNIVLLELVNYIIQYNVMSRKDIFDCLKENINLSVSDIKTIEENISI